MALLFLTASAFLFYSTSKYFPLSVWDGRTQSGRLFKTAGAVLLLLGTVALAQQMAVATAIVTALVIFMTVLPLLAFSLTLYPKSWIGWSATLIIILIIDLFTYAG